MNTTSRFGRAALAAAALTMLSGASFALDLMGAYEKALQVDPARLGAEDAVIAGREKAVQGRALLLPQVGLSASTTRIDDRSSTSLPPQLAGLIEPKSSGTVKQAAIQLVQPLYDAKSRADKRQLEQQTELAEIAYRHAQQDLMQRVSESYFGVLLAQEQLRVVRAEKAAVGMQRDRAKARFDVGRGKITDLQEAEARYDAVLTKEVSAESTLALRRAQFQETTGQAAEGLAELRPALAPQPPQPDSLQAWQVKGDERNARVLVRHSQLAIAGAEVDKNRLGARPTLDLVASYTYKGQSGSLSPVVAPDSSRSAAIGVQFSVPLFAGGALDSRQREAVAKQREAEQDLSAAKRDMRLQIQDAFLAVKTGVSRISALEQSLRSAQTALEATTLGRDLGTRTELDVLDAQQRLFSAQLDLAQARNDHLLGHVKLAFAAGELQEGDLRALNAQLAL